MGRRYELKPRVPLSHTQHVYVLEDRGMGEIDESVRRMFEEWSRKKAEAKERALRLVMERGGGAVVVVNFDGTSELIEVPGLH